MSDEAVNEDPEVVETPVEEVPELPEDEAPSEPEPPTPVRFRNKDESFRGEAHWYDGEGFRLFVHIPDPGFQPMSYRWEDTDPIVFQKESYGTPHPGAESIDEILQSLNYVVEGEEQ